MSDNHFANSFKTKLKKGDEVTVLAGKSKGVTGKIDRIDCKNHRVFVAGANMYKRHQKPDAKHPDGGIIDKAMSLHISNVGITDPKSKKPTRVGYKTVAEKKVRIAKSSGQEITA